MSEEIPRLEKPIKGFFRVSRTSGASRLNVDTSRPPCDGAVLRLTEYKLWRKAEDRWEPQWFVEIPDIVGFVHKVGKPCIVMIGPDGQEEIEIYDDYRE